ncbi:transglutaminase superfamily protein [Chitinophaga polysaccharea]|uniref:Transglutaminase superfamily protein n=1 Tax=Chitinophaga polysaccharea TaxID=1293035 RepID=A0A561Q1G4_9BACT|nr:DUF3857 domain-containing protein [Chitinophaga polysaccharea]TWF44206.1 transglutaminase superfamily protein [Chitinophaga polysaccharea]
MKRVVNAILILFLLCPIISLAGDYEKAWEAIHKNDMKSAVTYLQKVIKSGGPQKNSAVSTLVLLHHVTDYADDFSRTYFNPLGVLSTPAPYAYALWFNGALLGDYGVKSGSQLDNLDRIINDSVQYNGSMRAAARYFKTHHLRGIKQQSMALALFPQIGAIEEWAYAGPFDNLMGSGFDKDYGPAKHPTGSNFISKNNNPINWFVPLYTTREGWTFVGPAFASSNAVGYLQSFVKSSSDMDVVLCLGGNGAMKVWVNDKQVISQPEEQVTELDWWKTKVHLNKGYNRILLQLGYTDDNSTPHFIVRLTDEQYNPVKGITAQNRPESYQPDLSKGESALIPHFAEEYFKKEIAQHPADPVLAILLSKVYVRNQEWDKAKAVMFKWQKDYPKDALVLNYYIDCLSGNNDRTEITERMELMKALVPDNYWMLAAKMNKLEEEKNYTEAMEILDKLIAMKGEHQYTTFKKLQLLMEQEKIDSALQLLKFAYEKYPNVTEVVQVMSLIESKVHNNPAKALEVLEKNRAERFNFKLLDGLTDEYLNQGKTTEAVALMQELQGMARYDANSYTKLIKYYYGRQDYDSALKYLRIQHQISPYSHVPLGDMANCYLQKKQNDSAIHYYRQALAMYAGGFGYREKLRTLENKPPMDKYFPVLNYYKEIEAALKKQRDSTQSYAYIFDEKNVIVYPEGAGEQTINTAIIINNKKGISRWKEISIPYNTVYQDVIIVKAEVIKANGAKVPAETNENEIVFTRLDEGDVIYFNYKVNSYGRGRLGREFWDKFYFSGFVPRHISSYNVLISDSIPLYYEYVNGGAVKPNVSKHEQFKLYSWREDDITAVRSESYMPSLNDIGKVLHLSTVKDWDVIGEWYSDITRAQSKEDFEINEAWKEIFPFGAEKLDDFAKAKRIYEYIEKNIAYSSVSFRQGAYVPQRAGKTLVTRLGDCKDLSTLFLAFARKAGVEANLILVSTQDYGEKNMQLPSMDFNHCIIRYKAEGKDYYLELTDNALPFNSLSSALAGAQILNIPYNYKNGEKIGLLSAANFAPKMLRRRLDIDLSGADQHIISNCAYSGELASQIRHSYQHKTREETKDAVQHGISGMFKNQVVLDSFNFRNLDNLEDTVWLQSTFTVKNDVINVGDFNMIKPAFMDIVATADIFTPEARQHPFEYNNYENTDNYTTEIHIKLPTGKQFDQVPGNTNLKWEDMSYDLSFKKETDDKLVISRQFKTNCNKIIGPVAFKELETFFTGIIKAEQKYVSFK